MLPWILAALCLLWALYECFRPRPIVARFVPHPTDREDELLTQCIDLRTENEDLRELAADMLVDLHKLCERYKRREAVATAATDGGPG